MVTLFLGIYGSWRKGGHPEGKGKERKKYKENINSKKLGRAGDALRGEGEAGQHAGQEGQEEGQGEAARGGKAS